MRGLREWALAGLPARVLPLDYEQVSQEELGDVVGEGEGKGEVLGVGDAAKGDGGGKQVRSLQQWMVTGLLFVMIVLVCSGFARKDEEIFMSDDEIREARLAANVGAFSSAPALARLFPSNETILENLPMLFREYATFHAKAVADPQPEHKYLVYSCRKDDQMRHEGCGGIGYRIRGILSTFAMAIATKRVFVIDWDYPVRLEKSMEPSLIDWASPMSHIQTIRESGQSYEFHDYINRGFNAPNFLKHMKSKVVELKFNVDTTRESWKSDFSKLVGPSSVIGKGFPPLLRTWLQKMLIRPSPAVERLVMRHAKIIGLNLTRPYLGAHLRMGLLDPKAQDGGSMGDAGSRQKMSDVPTFRRCAQKLASAGMLNETRDLAFKVDPRPAPYGALMRGEKPQVFIASDSKAAKRKLAQELEKEKTFSESCYFDEDAFVENSSSARVSKKAMRHKKNQAASVSTDLFDPQNGLLEVDRAREVEHGEHFVWVELILMAAAQCQVVSHSSFSWQAIMLARDISLSGHCFATFDDCEEAEIRHRIKSPYWNFEHDLTLLFCGNKNCKVFKDFSAADEAEQGKMFP